MKHFMTAFRVWLFMMMLTGVFYPGLVTLLGQQLFPSTANGSLLVKDGRTIGSELIGQNFTSPRYFHSRPSASNYDAMPAKSSNAILSNLDYWNNLKQSKVELCLTMPSDDLSSMIMNSGSGLDPDITIAAACGQIPRIVQERKIPAVCVENILDKGKKGNLVNVLKLNIALDESCPDE